MLLLLLLFLFLLFLLLLLLLLLFNKTVGPNKVSFSWDRISMLGQIEARRVR
jgi:hypothetical protein